ncbi:MAG: small subunit ribosomal protein [Thermoplasmata archaeon]|jgi:small subunit ribosomal protein S15|nr:small subunit ribosomal protein [Thermoplasmata archaeon]
MARVHARRRGSSRSRAPAREEAPEWQPLEKQEIIDKIVALARDGRTGAYIGLVLRDQHGVPDVKLATGMTMREILEKNGVAPQIPEDLQNLMKRAVHLQGHLATHRRDLHNGRGLTLIEARIRRLADYYRRIGRLPADWRYSAETAQLVVE